jgi:predicted transcriptional regulator
MSSEFDVSIFRPDRPGIRKVLGDLEAEIMELIWELSESRGGEGTRNDQGSRGTTVRDVFEVLYERRKMAYTTVMNTMTRLAKKNLLRVEKQDAVYIYYPNFTQDEFISRFVGLILSDLLVSFSGQTIESLTNPRDPRAATRAHQLLAEIERRREEEEGREEGRGPAAKKQEDN